MLFMTKCSVVGCVGEAGLPGTARGLCRSHYKRFNRYGDAEVELRKVASWKGQQCWVRSCGRKITANGVCEMHYARVKRKQNRELLKTRSQAYLKRASDKRVALAGRPKPDACEVCTEPGRRIVFDHCHANGQFRGWICDRCNKTLGMVKDSPRLLIMLAEYLTTNGEAHVEANYYAAKQTA